MKLQADIDGQTRHIEVKHEDGKLTAIIDGRTIEAEVSEPEPGVYLFKTAGRVFEAYAGPSTDGTSIVSVRGRDHAVRITDPKRLRGSSVGSDAAGGRVEIKTAMPGKVVRILVSKDGEVKKDDGLIVVEAMKMQNEMRSPKDGRISEIRVAEGDTVSAGDVLIVVD